MGSLNEAIPRGIEPRRDVMKAPDDVSAMLKLKALGWGAKRIAAELGCSKHTVKRWLGLGRKAWLFCGSDRGGQRAAIMYGLITTAKLNDVDPQAWLADVLARIADLPQNRLHELLPWNWKAA